MPQIYCHAYFRPTNLPYWKRRASIVVSPTRTHFLGELPAPDRRSSESGMRRPRKVSRAKLTGLIDAYIFRGVCITPPLPGSTSISVRHNPLFGLFQVPNQHILGYGCSSTSQLVVESNLPKNRTPVAFASHEADRSSFQPRSFRFHERDMAQHVRNWGPLIFLIRSGVLHNILEKTNIVSL